MEDISALPVTTTFEPRRLVVWHERHALNYLGFVHLVCILLLLRHGRGDPCYRKTAR